MCLKSNPCNERHYYIFFYLLYSSIEMAHLFKMKNVHGILFKTYRGNLKMR